VEKRFMKNPDKNMVYDGSRRKSSATKTNQDVKSEHVLEDDAGKRGDTSRRGREETENTRKFKQRRHNSG